MLSLASSHFFSLVFSHLTMVCLAGMQVNGLEIARYFRQPREKRAVPWLVVKVAVQASCQSPGTGGISRTFHG